MAQKRRNVKADFEIYVILAQDNKEFYVGKIKKPNHYQADKDHMRLKNFQTKELFARSKESGILPKMYLLETINATRTESYARCVVWTRYFLKHGYQPVAAQKTVEYANDLTDENTEAYLRIKDIPFVKIINEERILVSNYKMREIKNLKNLISICTTPDEYDYIQNCAKKEGIAMSKYCKEMVIAGGVFHVDLSAQLREIRMVKKVLYEIQLAILQNGRYYPADLENIQKSVEKINREQREVIKMITKQSKATKNNYISCRKKNGIGEEVE